MGENGDEMLRIKSLPWCSSEVNRMFAKIDTYNMAGKLRFRARL